MTAASFTPEGPFSLAASARFLEGFTPASYDHAPDGVLRLAFPADDGRAVIGCALRQREPTAGRPGAVHAEFALHADGRAARPATGTAAAASARAQIARILSLDVDATGFPALAGTDPVVADLQARFPGLRPVLFHSPYEAAAWAVIGNRLRMTRAAHIKARLAEEHGRAVEVAGRRLRAFPGPARLRGIDHVPGLTDIKIERLHAIADAALDGRLDATRLRAQPAESALAGLKELPGIGPFSAELILIRGAGHPDVLPAAEPRVRKAMAAAYGLDAGAADHADHAARLTAIADAWRPFRSWVALLLRAHAQDRRAAQR